MIKNFVFDMGNVLMDFSPDYILSRYTDDLDTIKELKRVIFTSPLWGMLDNGDISFEEASEKISKESPDHLRDMVEDIFSTWQNHKVPRLDMLELVKELKSKGYGVYLCSNAAARFYTYKDKYEVFNYFDDLVISADINISKPDVRIYEYLLEKNELNAEECLFVDDIMANVMASQKVGMFGYHYNGNVALFREFLKTVRLI